MLNPLLTDEARRRVTALSRHWQALCVLERKLLRCVSYTRNGNVDVLAAEMGNRRIWDPAKLPAWLAFEVLQGIEIRRRQAVVALHMLDHPGHRGVSPDARGAVLQDNMGEGKSKVISVMLMLAACDRGEYPRLVYPSEYLLGEATQYLHACLTGAAPPAGRTVPSAPGRTESGCVKWSARFCLK